MRPEYPTSVGFQNFQLLLWAQQMPILGFELCPGGRLPGLQKFEGFEGDMLVTFGQRFINFRQKSGDPSFLRIFDRLRMCYMSQQVLSPLSGHLCRGGVHVHTASRLCLITLQQLC